jgi:hypothetical protein
MWNILGQQSIWDAINFGVLFAKIVGSSIWSILGSRNIRDAIHFRALFIKIVELLV